MKGTHHRGLLRKTACAAALVLVLGTAGSVPAENVRHAVFAVAISGSAETTMKKYQPLADYLSGKTGKAIDVRVVKKYEDILGLMQSGQADIGVFGSIAGSEAFLEKKVIPVARPEKGGVSTYRGFLIARKDSGARKVEDLKGKTFDSNGGSASVGKFFPEKLLRDRKADFPSFFSRVTTSAKHEAVVYKVLNGEADCGTVKDTVFGKMAGADPRVKNELVILATSQKFPDGNVMVRSGASAEFLRSIRRALLAMDKDREARPALEALGADRFVLSEEKEFETLGRAVHALERK